MIQPPRDPTTGRFIQSPLPPSPARYIFEEHTSDRLPPQRDSFTLLRSMMLLVIFALGMIAAVAFAVFAAAPKG